MIICVTTLEQFAAWLQAEEKSPATAEKYRREAAHFVRWLGDRPLNREAVQAYKEECPVCLPGRAGVPAEGGTSPASDLPG